MVHLAPLIYDLTIMLGVAAIVVLLFQRIRQPVVLGYLVAGIIIGPYTPPHAFVTDIDNIKILSELGVIFLMFSLGLEFSFHKLMRVGSSSMINGILNVVVMIILGYFAGRIMRWSYTDCIFLGAALAISSTTIIFKAIEELNLKKKRFAEVIFGVLIVEDLLAILLLVALSTIVATKEIFSSNMLFAAIQLVLVVGGWFLLGYFLLPSLFRKLAKYISQETLTIVSVALCLFLVLIASYFNYSTALGAFIMGSILAETVLGHRIEELIVPIRDIFGAVFFVSVGMLINPEVIFAQWPFILFISLVVILGKISVITFGTFITGQSLKTSVRAGFGMAQIGEFSFIILGLGLTLNAINHDLYPIIVAVSGITTFTTPYLIRLSGTISDTIERHLPVRIKFILDNYANWIYRAQYSNKSTLLNYVSIRFFINAILVAILFTLIHRYVYPEIVPLVGSMRYAKLLSALSAIIIASPFIWAMLFSHRQTKKSNYSKSKWNAGIFIIWFLALLEVILLTVIFFYTFLITIFFIIIAAIYFIAAYKHLEKSYQWFEKQLLGNIKKPANQAKYIELAPWETHFVELEVGSGAPFLNKTLEKCQIRENYNINIVAIYRTHHTILAPRGNETIRAGDKLIVLGTDEQIDLFNKQLLQHSPEHQTNYLENFSLKPIFLEKGHSLIGKSIRESKIRESMKGLIVGLERGNERILNPDPRTILLEDDLLLIIAEDE